MVSLLQTIDTAHEDMIHDAQMDYYGIRLATCSSDRSVKVFDIRNGTQKLVADLKGHEGPVWQIAWAHPMFGTVLASCSYDRKVILWKETDGVWSKLEEFKNHDSSVNSICWAPHEFGLMLACGSSDGAVSIVSTSGDGSWESQKINNAHTIGCNAVSWAPAQAKASAEISLEDSKALKRFVTGGCDNLVKIWKFSEAESKWWRSTSLRHTPTGFATLLGPRHLVLSPRAQLPPAPRTDASSSGQALTWPRGTSRFLLPLMMSSGMCPGL
ncbi:protein SEC13 homolog isoform X3 [Dermacentor silvarum]|uniref:protein SEC13 homolog isoform X3 n=1 Tax=Dermacentor silvarum TaxID=543639 RepID=UPI0021013A58|nr:protein SEC13 homolog isoform X3 [Dermacentor silvarum]